MERMSTYKPVLTLLFLIAFTSSVWAQQSLPPDSNRVKTPEEAYKGGMGIYLALRGFDLVQEGHNEEAAKILKQAIQLKPNYVEAHEGLARAYGNLQRWPDAITSYRQAIQLKPDFYQAYIGLGFAYGMVDKNNEALQAFKEAIRLKPTFALAHWGMANTYLAMGDRDAALKEHNILQNLDPEMAKSFEKYLYPTKR